jgi:hemerythrin
MIEWTPSLAVGVDEIDAQHRELFRRADLFVSGIDACSPQEIGVLLSYLRLYAVTHFGAEEEVMRASAFPGYAAHKRQHDQFVRDLLALSQEIDRRRGPRLDPQRVAVWIGRWLVDHVSREDVELARHLAARGEAGLHAR